MNHAKLIIFIGCTTLLLQSCQMPPLPTGEQQPDDTDATHTETIQPPSIATTPGPTKEMAQIYEKHLGAIWPDDTGKIIGTSVDSNGVVYIVNQDGSLHAFTAYGNEIWKYEGTRTFLSPAFATSDGDSIYLIDNNKQLVAVDRNGKEKMVFDIQGRLISPPIISPNKSVYLQTIDDSKQSINVMVYHVLPDGSSHSFTLDILDDLSNGVFASNGNIYLWDWGAIKILAPTGDMIEECKNGNEETLASNILAGPDNMMLYTLSNGKLIAKKEDCTVAWQSPVGEPEHNNARFNLTYDNNTLYVAGLEGKLYAIDINTGNILWKNDADANTGDITSVVTLKGDFIYGVTSRAKIIAFDAHGKKVWQDELYGIGIPTVLQALPNDDLFIMQNNQVAVYTNDPSRQYQLSQVVPHPVNEEQARSEIVSFILDFIVKNEIGEMADYVRTSGQPWVASPPEASIIVYAPAKGNAEDSWEYLDSQNPITVWWYANNTLTEVEDKQKAIDEYQKKYIDNVSGTIFVWGSYDFGIVKISSDYRSAEIYVGASCGPVCGHGFIYKLQRSLNGKWWIYDSTHLWQS